MGRRTAGYGCTLALVLLLGCGPGRGGAKGASGGADPSRWSRPPVILISIDTLRADRLPAYGYQGVATPHFDELRRDAVLFENAYSPVPLTLPSHASLLTGLRPPDHGVRDN
ncbi:MAG: sulfatase-like hydrolase/transferase, partial [Acidobacteria bacterium]|nr:sulfatase-like hydrolase/transferase [Acidobacteriota bacterium]